MTTRAQLIAKVNRELKDEEAYQEIAETGDGSKKAFNIGKGRLIVPDSETILINDAATSAYTMENENGRIILTAAPASAIAITGDYKSCKYSPQSKLDALNHVLTGGFLQQKIYDGDALTTVADTYSYTLPSGVIKLLTVWIYNSDGVRQRRLRQYDLTKSGNVFDTIIFKKAQAASLNIGLEYVKVFSALTGDSSVTDLPSAGERPAILKAAADVLATEEPPRLQSAKDLGHAGSSDGAKEMSHVQLSNLLEQKAITERARAGLNPPVVATSNIIND